MTLVPRARCRPAAIASQNRAQVSQPLDRKTMRTFASGWETPMTTASPTGVRPATSWASEPPRCGASTRRRAGAKATGGVGIELIDAEVMKEAQHLRVTPQQPRNEHREDGKADGLDNHKCGHATPLCGVRRNRRALCYETAVTKKLTRS